MKIILWCRIFDAKNKIQYVVLQISFFLPFKIEFAERGSLDLGRGESVGGGGCHCDGETFERDVDASEG